MLKHKNILGSVAIAGLLTSGVAWADGSYDRTNKTEAQTQQHGLTDYHDSLRLSNQDSVQTSEGKTVKEDMKIVDATGEEIGNVKEVLVDEQDAAAAVVIEVDNDAEMDDKALILDLNRATVDADQQRIVVAMSADELRALPEWNETDQ